MGFAGLPAPTPLLPPFPDPIIPLIAKVCPGAKLIVPSALIDKPVFVGLAPPAPNKRESCALGVGMVVPETG